MGTSHSSFNKANFKRGIRGYRKMFASLHLEERELKKLWVEFGKIDADNDGTVSIRELLSHCNLDFTPFAYRLFGIFDADNSGAVDFREFVLSTWNCCTMDEDSLQRFAFDLFDQDHSRVIETTEMEGMLRDMYGESFTKNPTAALTMKRVEELATRGNGVKLAKEELKGKAGGQAKGPVCALSFEDFREFCRLHAGMLFPAYTLQRAVRSRIVSESFWKGCYNRRNNARSSWGQGQKHKQPPRKRIDLEQLSTMITLNEDSSRYEPTVTAPATISPPHAAPGLHRLSPGEGNRVVGNHVCTSVTGSPKAPAMAIPDPEKCGTDTPNKNKRRSDPKGRGAEREKIDGDGRRSKKRGLSTRGGAVAVDADQENRGGERADNEAHAGASPEKVPRCSMQRAEGKTYEEDKSRARKTLRASLDAAVEKPAPALAPEVNGFPDHPTRMQTMRAKRKTISVSTEAGGRRHSAWDGGREESVTGRADGLRRRHGSHADSTAAAIAAKGAAAAAAVYELPALRETSANKMKSEQARGVAAGRGSKGNAKRRSFARPISAGGDHLARQHRRASGHVTAAASSTPRGIGASRISYPARGDDLVPPSRRGEMGQAADAAAVTKNGAAAATVSHGGGHHRRHSTSPNKISNHHLSTTTNRGGHHQKDHERLNRRSV